MSYNSQRYTGLKQQWDSLRSTIFNSSMQKNRIWSLHYKPWRYYFPQVYLERGEVCYTISTLIHSLTHSCDIKSITCHPLHVEGFDVRLFVWNFYSWHVNWRVTFSAFIKINDNLPSGTLPALVSCQS